MLCQIPLCRRSNVYMRMLCIQTSFALPLAAGDVVEALSNIYRNEFASYLAVGSPAPFQGSDDRFVLDGWLRMNWVECADRIN